MATQGVRISREQALYGGEALTILVALPAWVAFSLVAFYPTIFVIAALPALALAITGFLKPGYFAATGVTDTRRPLRRYVHICAGISVVPAFLTVLGLTEYLAR